MPKAKINSLNNDNDMWLPFDYASDDDMPPSDQELYSNANVPQHNVVEEMHELPIVEPPLPPAPKAKKKTAAEKVTSKPKNDDHDYDIDAAMLKYEQNLPDYKAPKPASNRKSAAPKVAPKSKQRASPTGVQEIEKHQSLLMQIQRYSISARFKNAILESGLRLSGLEDHSIEELENVLTRVRTVISNKNNTGGGGMLGTMILGGIGFSERIPLVNRFADINGLSNLLSQDEEFSDLCEQLSIDYSIMSVMSPEKRMLMLIVRSGIRMNGINQARYMMVAKAADAQQRQQQHQQQQQQQPVAQPIAQQVPAIVKPNSNVMEY